MGKVTSRGGSQCARGKPVSSQGSVKQRIPLLSVLSLLAFLLTLALERLRRLHRVVLKLYLNQFTDLESFFYKAVFDSDDVRYQGLFRRLPLLEK
ncbi:hypothetical protein HPB47_008600 [Ixodes persulcatus]|uniref:Uncharacterized protein n=1 Tax=Ixodes persulcatus TaxID=34615 RepID=A0AC60P4B9_IXOPE|nr:hypothetical protein HPB47_008600 [Ixodes persulcatus]